MKPNVNNSFKIDVVDIFTQESDSLMSFMGVITNAVDHVYYPVEKICWLAEHKCLNLENPDRWDTISSIFWVSSIYLNLMRYLPQCHLMFYG